MNNFNQVFISGDKAFPEQKSGFNSVSDTLIRNYESKPIETPKPSVSERMGSIMNDYNKQIQNSADLYKSGQQGLLSTLGQTLAGAVKATGRSFALPITVATDYTFDYAGDLIRKGREAQKQADEQAIADGRLVRGRDFILSDQPKFEDQVGELARKGIELGKPLIDKYESLTPAQKANVKAGTDLFSGVFDIGTSVIGAKGASSIIEGVGKKVFDPKTGKFIIESGQKIANAPKVTKDFLLGREKTLDEAVSQVLQGQTKDMTAGKITLANIDTDGVQTFKELNDRINQAFPKFAGIVDSELAKDTKIYKLPELAVKQTTKGGQEVSTDYVTKALKDLQELYTKTGDDLAKANVDEVIQKATAEGLTRKDVNDISRIYGSEFSDKAFAKNGDALTSVNAQAFENTRIGLKDVARAGLGGDEARAADKVMSSFFNTQRLVQRNIEAVNKLQQKIDERGFLATIGHGIAKYGDLLSGGSIRAFIGGLLPRGAGYKVYNALDLEEVLARNLRTIEKALTKDTAKEIDDILKSGFNPSAIPEGLADDVSGLDNIKQKLLTEKDLAFDRTPEEIRATLKKVLGRNVPVEMVKNPSKMVSDDALGQVAKGTITLLEKNQTFSEAVANHEAWHYYRNYIAKAKDTGTISKIEQELVDARPSEIARLKKAGYKKSDWGEEIMADEFARYYRTGKTVSEKVKVFFDQIIQKVQLMFEGRSDMLKLFKNVPLEGKVNTKGIKKMGKEIDSVKIKIDDNGNVLYHSSNDTFQSGKPEFDAYFGGEDFVKTFGMNEFGKNVYKVNLPKGMDVLDLNDTNSGRSGEFMIRIIKKQFPNEKDWIDGIKNGDPQAINDFYDLWTDKNIILPLLKEWKLDGVKFQDEYILPKTTIDKLEKVSKKTTTNKK